MLNFRLYRVPLLVDFGAVFGREQGKPHNVLGYIPESISRKIRFRKTKSKSQNVPGYVLEKCSRTFSFWAKEGKGKKNKEKEKGGK